MATPLFSVLIPTRERPATFRHTLATVAAQPGDDYEIVVADNCSGPETREIVAQCAAPRVRYSRSDEILPMSRNWERGLELCEGEYVTVLGDDDGFVPSTLAMARKLAQRTQAELMSWATHTYWWPDTIVPWNRNRLYLSLEGGATLLDSRETLEHFYRGGLPFGLIPMIYNAFFHRGLIEEARGRYDAFFVPPEIAPDIASGILGLHLTEQYAHSARPFTIRGNSGKSNGTAHWARSRGAEQRAAYYRDEGVRPEDVTHALLVASPNLNIGVANIKLKCKEAYFPHDDALSVDLLQVLREMLATLNFDPEAYDDNLRDARAFAAKLGVKLDAAEIPPKEQRVYKSTWGPMAPGDKGWTQLAVNCELASVDNVAAAARLADALLPPVESYLAQ